MYTAVAGPPDQVYVIPPLAVKVTFAPEQMDALEGEIIILGNAETVILLVLTVLAPQALLAVTLTFPLTPATTEMVLLVEPPVHPPGKLQVYPVAVGSFVTE